VEELAVFDDALEFNAAGTRQIGEGDSQRFPESVDWKPDATYCYYDGRVEHF